MKLWIRVDACTARDPKVQQFAERLGVSVPTAVGHLVMLWGVMAEHTPDGVLEAVGVRSLEHWAEWAGKRGRFAEAFLATFVSEGVVKGWSERQGALVTRMERDRKRWHKRKSAETPRSLRDDSASTERNGTVRHNNKSVAPDGAPTPPAGGDAIPLARPGVRAQRDQTAKGGWPARMTEAWRELGYMEPARFGKALSPVVYGGEDEPPPGRYRVDDVERALRGYVRDALRNDRGQFASPADFVKQVARWVDETTPLAQRADAARWGVVA